ncbi:unnamed protein product [Amoebophrya sp. A120]|nr:unnamed protein product [Amoebophrya sp. A120]|eukprot:GSA120T00016180001.1
MCLFFCMYVVDLDCISITTASAATSWVSTWLFDNFVSFLPCTDTSTIGDCDCEQNPDNSVGTYEGQLERRSWYSIQGVFAYFCTFVMFLVLYYLIVSPCLAGVHRLRGLLCRAKNDREAEEEENITKNLPEEAEDDQHDPAGSASVAVESPVSATKTHSLTATAGTAETVVAQDKEADVVPATGLADGDDRVVNRVLVAPKEEEQDDATSTTRAAEVEVEEQVEAPPVKIKLAEREPRRNKGGVPAQPDVRGDEEPEQSSRRSENNTTRTQKMKQASADMRSTRTRTTEQENTKQKRTSTTNPEDVGPPTSTAIHPCSLLPDEDEDDSLPRKVEMKEHENNMTNTIDHVPQGHSPTAGTSPKKSAAAKNKLHVLAVDHAPLVRQAGVDTAFPSAANMDGTSEAVLSLGEDQADVDGLVAAVDGSLLDAQSRALSLRVGDVDKNKTGAVNQESQGVKERDQEKKTVAGRQASPPPSAASPSISTLLAEDEDSLPQRTLLLKNSRQAAASDTEAEDEEQVTLQAALDNAAGRSLVGRLWGFFLSGSSSS